MRTDAKRATKQSLDNIIAEVKQHTALNTRDMDAGWILHLPGYLEAADVLSIGIQCHGWGQDELVCPTWGHFGAAFGCNGSAHGVHVWGQAGNGLSYFVCHVLSLAWHEKGVSSGIGSPSNILYSKA